MEQELSTLNKSTFKKFVKSICVVAKKQKERDTARHMLKQQFQRVKQTTLMPNPKRWLVEDELKKLEMKISHVIAKEIELLNIGRRDSMVINELKEKISSLEYRLGEAARKSQTQSTETIQKLLKKNDKIQHSIEDNEKIRQLTKAVADMKDKINKLVKTKKKRSKKKR